jgi:hypothetical protein
MLNRPKLIYVALFLLLLNACSRDNNTPPTYTINGGATKGPLINALVTVYKFDSSQPGFKGELIDSGTTDSRAVIVDLALPLPLTPPYIMEFTSTPGKTIDMTTGVFPVMSHLSTVITQAMLDGGNSLYATPLTTLAVEIAKNNASSNIKAADFLLKISSAATQVITTVGFGMPLNIDIFTTPPLLNDTVNTSSKRYEMLAYRTAIEALTAVVFQMQQATNTGFDSDAILGELAKDLSDGLVDGNVNDSFSQVYDSTILNLFTQNPATLMIPNAANGETVAQVIDILIAETLTTGTTASISELSSGDITFVITPANTTAVNNAVWDRFNWNENNVWQ